MKNYDQIFGFVSNETEQLFDYAVANASDGDIFVHAGVYRGKSLIYLKDKITSSGKNIQLHAIDNWSWVYEWDDSDLLPKDEFFENLGTRQVNFLELNYSEAIEQFTENSIKFIFLQIEHQSYLDAIDKSLPKLVSNGIISGTDYNWNTVKDIVDSKFTNVSTITESRVYNDYENLLLNSDNLDDPWLIKEKNEIISSRETVFKKVWYTHVS